MVVLAEKGGREDRDRRLEKVRINLQKGWRKEREREMTLVGKHVRERKEKGVREEVKEGE